MSNHKLAAYAICALALIGLASAQINFSTGWGKRSSAHHQHAMRTTSEPSSINRQPEKTVVADETPFENQDVGFDQCRSLLKSLGLINLISQTEMLRVDKYARSGQSSGEVDAPSRA